MRRFLVLLICTVPLGAVASDAIVDEPDGVSYRFVSHYSVRIDASADVVWKRLVDLGAWMYEFEMSHVSGVPGGEGEVFRLYPGEDFLLQVVSLVPHRLLVVANLPSTFRDEFSTGTGVISLHESEGTTTVDITMSRRYTWLGDGPNPVKAERESAEFAEANRSMWQDRFLGRLRSLAQEVQSP